MKTKYLDPVLAGTLLATVVSGFGYSWQLTTAHVGGSISMSADGRVICAVSSVGHPAISTDFGNTWTVNSSSPTTFVFNPGEVAISANGARMYTIFSSTNLGLFKSSDQGGSWSRTIFPGTSLYFQKSPVACSADGSIVIAASAIGPIYYSLNGGASCSTSSVPDASWVSLACSADGGRMVAALNNGSIYFSTDFGATWTPTNLPAQSWNGACISSDGNWVGATSGTGSYISSNSGVTWLTNQIAGSNLVCSATGNDWLIVGAQIYTSTNGGVTWQTNFDSGTQWPTGAMSADGREVIVVGYGQGGGDWLGRETPHPQLNLRHQGSTVALSWPIPSTNFVLQQKTDSTSGNWLTVPISPSLIFTNLQQEITVSATASNTFFRLMAQ